MYIAEMITRSIVETWKQGENILIEAQTGSGKSSFMLNDFAQYCKEHNLKALLFSNRDLLKKQNKKLAPDNIDCYNYQYIEKLSPENIKSFLLQYDIILFDECHYFFKDSNFNENTDKILDYAKTSEKQIKIFASATPEPLYYTGIKFNHEYHVPHNYSFIRKLIFYDNMSDIIKEIETNSAKSLCFLSNTGEACKYALTHNKTTSFICSKSNTLWRISDQEAAKKLIETSKFDAKILMATTVIDNGINIVDREVKNVVIDFHDQINIIQPLGRKRIQPGEEIVLYLKRPTQKEINQGRFANPSGKSQAAIIYRKFLSDYYKTIDKMGYMYYWMNYFGIPEEKIECRTTYTQLREFLKSRANQEIQKEELEKEFGRIIPIKENARICTYNNFLKKNLIPYEIVSERYYDNNKTRKRRWIVRDV